MTRTRAAFTLATLLVFSSELIPAKPNQEPSNTLTIETGERLVLELETPLHTRVTRKGDSVYLRTAADVRVGDRVLVPKGSSVKGTVTMAKRPGRIKGRAELQLRLDEVRLADGTTTPLGASIVRAGVMPVGANGEGDPKLKGESGSGGNVGSVVSGGMQGAVIGVMTSGGKGALYGGAVGAGIGLAGILLRRGPDLDLPQGTIFEARFDRPLSIAASALQRPAELAQASKVLEREAPIEAAEAPDFRTPERPRLARPDKPNMEPPVERVKIDPAPEPAASPATAPSPSEAAADPGAFKLSVNVQMVLVDAVVQDRLGRSMENLRKEDFRVFEDGTEQAIQSFSRDEYPLAVALVIDRSGSVAPFMNEIRHAAYRALMQLKREDQVCLFAFAGDVNRLVDLTTDRQKIADRIATIRAGGGTNIIDALHNAIVYLSMVAPERRRAVILVSDNRATTQPKASEKDTIHLALESETVIYSVKTAGLGLPVTMRITHWVSGAGSVRKVTEETGGEIIDVGGSGSLDAALAAVVMRLKLRYTLGYYPSNPAPGSFRRIEVRLAERYGRPSMDYTVHARNGYYTRIEGRTTISSGKRIN